MKTQIQLIVSTIALTVLIWIYADQAVHDTYQTTVIVRYVPPPEPGSAYVLRIAGARNEAPDTVRAELTFRGPKSAIRRLENDDASGRLRLVVPVNDELQPGPQPLRDLLEDVSRLAEIRSRGIVLQRATPRTVQIEVDRYRNVPVALDVNAGAFEKAIVGKPAVRPDTVSARVLESTLKGDTKLPPLKIPIEEELQARSDQPGSTLWFDVALHSSWPGIDATFTPDRVRVSVTLARRTVRERITLIPLGVLVEPQDFFGKYELEWQDETGGHFTQAIDVRVPVEKAGQLKGGMIDAYVMIRDTDLPKELPGGLPTSVPSTQESWIEREIHFVLPPGFDDVKIEGPPHTVKFRIKKGPDARKSPAASPLLQPASQ